MTSIAEIHKLFLQTDGVCTDTRKIFQNCTFVTLKGANFNGNKFVQQALDAGASLVICDEEQETQDPRIVTVQDGLTTLQQLASFHRQHFTFPLIGITGSNGKTTTKELIRDVLRKKWNVKATDGNLNNHIGVPLTLLSFPLDLDIGIVEMGANHQKEIAFLSEIAQPNYGLITNIGKAHLEGFGGIEGVKKGKKELYDYIARSNGRLFVPELDGTLQSIAIANKNISHYGKDHFPKISKVDDSSTLQFEVAFEQNTYVVKSQLAGEYNANNALAAMAIGHYFNVPESDMVNAIEEYIPENNRSQIKKTNSNTLIMDAYNANPTSMSNALQDLAKHHTQPIAIVGDMLEMGEYSSEEHQKIVDLAKSLNLETWFVGPEFGKSDLNGAIHFGDTQSAKEHLQQNPMTGRTILLKGSRGIALEKLVDQL
ncbi:MAG: UDP-N-acetylmuramoyl-tripeptide--D-alanyl-D-alanine ligase [Flavobacteriales bacterium]|nr:UDP-N-acetylmuramoyl-tripeptide--D-alanyl-D-alanine ligase [Flavobacteriales bacterium]